MAIQDDFDIHPLGPLVGPFGVGRSPVFQPQLFLPSHPVLCCCKRFEPGRRPVVPLIVVHLAISLFNVPQLNLRAEFEHEAGFDMLHNLGLDPVSDGTFQILGEAKQDRSPAPLDVVALRFWKVVKRVKLSHNFVRDAPHPYEALLFIKPSNQGVLIATTRAHDSPGGLQVCHSHIHSPGRIPVVAFLQLVSVSGQTVARSEGARRTGWRTFQSLRIINTYIYSGGGRVSLCLRLCARFTQK